MNLSLLVNSILSMRFTKKVAAVGAAIAIALAGAVPHQALATEVAPSPSTATITERGPLGQSGRWFTDGDGRAFLTQGSNIVYKHDPYTPEAGGFNEDDADWLVQQGFDSMRVGIIWKAVEPKPGEYNDEYLDSIARTISMLTERGIAVLVDAHQDMYNEKFEGEFAPDWAVIDDGVPSLLKVGFPANQALNIGLIRAYDNFLNNREGPGGVGLQERYAAMWGHVAKRLGDMPGLMGYDIINEPWPGSAYPLCYLALGDCGPAKAKLDELHQKAADQIVAKDADAIVHYEPYSMWNTGLNTDPAAPQVPETAGTALSWHVYCTTNALFNTYTGCDFFDGRVFDNAEIVSSGNGSATLLSEFGATDDADTLNGVISLARRHMVGWQYWSYCGCNDPTTQNQKEQGMVFDPTVPGPVGADAFNRDKMTILAAPHLRAVAGTPQATDWNRDTRVYQASWNNNRVDGTGVFAPGSTSELVVPSINFPNGFTVNVEGGHATVAADGQTVHIVSTADQVTVTIQPK